jgi:hypothetical protein
MPNDAIDVPDECDDDLNFSLREFILAGEVAA